MLKFSLIKFTTLKYRPFHPYNSDINETLTAMQMVQEMHRSKIVLVLHPHVDERNIIQPWTATQTLNQLIHFFSFLFCWEMRIIIFCINRILINSIITTNSYDKQLYICTILVVFAL